MLHGLCAECLSAKASLEEGTSSAFESRVCIRTQDDSKEKSIDRLVTAREQMHKAPETALGTWGISRGRYSSNSYSGRRPDSMQTLSDESASHGSLAASWHC